MEAKVEIKAMAKVKVKVKVKVEPARLKNGGRINRPRIIPEGKK